MAIKPKSALKSIRKPDESDLSNKTWLRENTFKTVFALCSRLYHIFEHTLSIVSLLT